MAEALLEVEGLVAGYGDVRVLWGVGFEVRASETVCLIGSNGAGKTTLLSAVSGLVKPQAGRIRFDGRDITRASPRAVLQAGIAHVPEGRRLFGPMSVLDNLLMGAYLRHDSTEVRNDLEHMFELFPILASRRHQAAGTLSGGEQQMCAIARGVMSRPRLLMIDELSLGLAPQVVEQLGEVIAQITQGGLSVLLVEQDVMTAFEIARRGVVLDTGTVSMQGPVAELSNDAAVREAYMGIS